MLTVSLILPDCLALAKSANAMLRSLLWNKISQYWIAQSQITKAITIGYFQVDILTFLTEENIYLRKIFRS